MHAKIMVRPQIAWSDALRACIPKCMQIVHTLDPQGILFNFQLRSSSESFVRLPGRPSAGSGVKHPTRIKCSHGLAKTASGAALVKLSLEVSILFDHHLPDSAMSFGAWPHVKATAAIFALLL